MSKKSVIPGRYETSLNGYKAFVPDSLPPRIILPASVSRRVEDATHLLGQVEMTGTLLRSVELLRYSSLQREALASNTIEGTIASPQELVRFQVSQQAERQAAREVANYAVALDWGCQEIPEFPLTSRVVLGLHERLMEGVRGQSNAGRFKVYQNGIGSRPDDRLEDAVFVPAPPERTPELIAGLERYWNGQTAETKVVQCALAHYQFETIHPFADGNGRVGRLLIILHLIHLGLLSAPLIYPSAYFERNRQHYYRHLQNVRDQGAWIEWIEFFVQGMVEQCRETIAFVQTIQALKDHIHVEVSNVSRRASIQGVLNAFFQYPVLSVPQITQRANMAFNSVQNALETLQQQHIVYEITGMKSKRVYGCRPILNAIFGETGDAMG